MRKESDCIPKRRLWLLLLLCFPVSLALLLLAQYAPGFAEWYATGPYVLLSRAGNFLTGLLPFSLAELLVVVLPLLALIWIAVQAARAVRSKGNRGRMLVDSGLRLLCAVGIVLLLFTTNCGINYSRYSFAEISNLPIQDSSIDELYALHETTSAYIPDDGDLGLETLHRFSEMIAFFPDSLQELRI